MQYALLVYENPGAYMGFTAEQRHAITAEYLAIRDDPRVTAGAQLKPVDPRQPCAGSMVRALSPMARSPRRRRSSAATTSSRRTMSMLRWRSRSVSPRFDLVARWKFDRWWSYSADLD